MAAFRHSHCFATPIQSVLCWFLCTFSYILQIRHKSKAGTGLSNHGFFFYFTRSWGTCKVSRILVNRKPPINTSARLRLTWPFFVLYDCFLLDANVRQSTDHSKSKKVNDLQTFQDTVMKWRLSSIQAFTLFCNSLQSVLCWFLCTFSYILQIWHKSKAGTGLSNHGFFFYSTRSWGTCKVSRIIVNRNPPINTSSGLYKTYLAVLCAVWLFSTWRKCDAVNRSWQIKKSKRPSNFSRYCNEMTSWQHSGIHTVLQLPSNLSSVGSSAPSEISCKQGISPKQGLVYLITRRLRHMQSIQDSCQPKPPNQYFFRIM